MKNTYLFFLFLGLLFVSCSGDKDKSIKNDTPKESSTLDFEGFEEFDLRPYEINASLMLPEGNDISVKHQLDEFTWRILMEKQVYITIQDWGTENGFDQYLKQLKKLDAQVDIIEKDDFFVMYKSNLGTGEITYHTAAQHKIEGINYVFESNNKQGLSKEKIDLAVKSIKSVEQIY